MARGFFSGLLDIIFPPRCTFCRKFLKNGERQICGSCVKTLPYCNEERKGDFFTLCVAPLYYKGSVRGSILRFKFKNATNYAACYGRMLSECIAKSLSGQYDYITWVSCKIIYCHTFSSMGNRAIKGIYHQRIYN